MPAIFISYRRDDSSDATGRLHDRLEAHFGRENVFMDVDTIPFGVDFREHLHQAVARCDILLAVIGDDWLEARDRQGQRRLDDPRDFVAYEIRAALARNIPVIPVLVGRASMPGDQDLPEGLKGLAYRNAAEVRSGRDFHDHVGRLIRGIGYLARQGREYDLAIGEDDWAIADYDEALRLDPEDAIALRGRGRCPPPEGGSTTWPSPTTTRPSASTPRTRSPFAAGAMPAA
jgi:hypothetical protein